MGGECEVGVEHDPDAANLAPTTRRTYIGMAYIVMVYVVMAYVVMASRGCGGSRANHAAHRSHSAPSADAA